MSDPDMHGGSDLRAKAEFISALAGADDKTADAFICLMAQMRAGTARKADYRMAQDAFDAAKGITRPRGPKRAWLALYEAAMIPVCDFTIEVLHAIWWHGVHKWFGGRVPYFTVSTDGGGGEPTVRFGTVDWYEWRRMQRNRRRDALAEFFEAEAELARTGSHDIADYDFDETPEFQAANQRVRQAEQQLPWWWRAWLSDTWRLPWFRLRHPVIAWKAGR